MLFPVIALLLAGCGWVQKVSAQPKPRADQPGGPAHVTSYDPIRQSGDDRPRIPRTYGPPQEDRVIKKGLLAPSVQDREDHSAFLKGRYTGLIKLLPREIYDWRTYHTEKRLDVKGGGAYYSFYFLSHEYGYGSDLSLDHNSLSVGFVGADYGILADLGDLPLESLSGGHESAAFLAQYESAPSVAAARCESKRFRNGLNIGGVFYKSSVPVHVNSTYLLRSIIYLKWDQLVGFRVVRQDADGSVTIAWKLLKNWYPPQFHVVDVSSEDKCPTR